MLELKYKNKKKKTMSYPYNIITRHIIHVISITAFHTLYSRKKSYYVERRESNTLERIF